MTRIVTFGETLVEIMADEPGNGFREPISLKGPFPSGAPAIFISQAARMGAQAALISAVGDDDFGRVNLDRLADDGVNVSAVEIVPSHPTGTAFVRYRSDGERDFVFNITHSAAGQIRMTKQAKHVAGQADHLHIVGNALYTDALREMARDLAQDVKTRGGTVSFDPNLRPEMMSASGLRDAVEQVLGLTDIFLPSGSEIFLGVGGEDLQKAREFHLDNGMSVIVHKQGSKGATFQNREMTFVQPPYAVDEVDPTGAGDCFGAAFVASWLGGERADIAMQLAAAAGALAVTKRGPMSGAAHLRELREFIESRGKD